MDHTWVRLGSGGEAEVEEALLAAVQADPDYQAGCARVLVFTKNTANADRVRHAGLLVWVGRVSSFRHSTAASVVARECLCCVVPQRSRRPIWPQTPPMQ